MQLHTTTALGNDAFRYKKKYNAFMGISIRNKYFTKDTMREYFLWLDEYFQETVILLMDDPDRYNLMVFKDVSEDRALEKAREISDYVKSAYEKIKRQHNISSIRVLQFKDFINNEEYKNINSKIEHLIQHNETIKRSLVDVMDENTKAKIEHLLVKKNIPKYLLEQYKDYLLRYITEEFIAIIYFLTKGYLIEIDPHKEFLTKQLFYDPSITTMARTLNIPQRGHIYISPRNTSYYKNPNHNGGNASHI